MHLHIQLRRRRLGWLILLVLLLWPAGTARAEQAPALKTFVATHRCALIEKLIGVQGAGNPRSMQGRFLILARADEPQAYIQCLFQDGQRVLCEASSGFFSSRAGEPRRFRLRPAEVARLARYRFSADDSRGNYQRLITLGATIDLTGVASMALAMMHDIYGATTASRLTVNAPLLSPRVMPLVTSTCAPSA